MSVRKFWLTNGTLQNGILKKYEFTVPSSKVFLNNPTGLGYSQTITTIQYADVLNGTEAQNFPQIQGEVVFFDGTNADRYDKYNKFIEFLSYSPLVIHYQIPKTIAEEYTMDVQVVSVEKSESKPDGLLRCNFSLQGLSRWQGAEVTKTGTSSSYSITNSGHLPCGFTIEINGTSMKNPYITLTQDNEMYGEAKFDATLSKMFINSKDGEQEVILENNGVVSTNPLSYQDLSISNGSIYVTFIKLARGTSTLAIGMDSGSITGVTIKHTPLYRSV